VRTVPPQVFDSTTAILDVRRHVHGEQIRGALRYDPNALLDADKLILPFSHEGQIVLCTDDEHLAQRIADKLLDSGYKSVVSLAGGMRAWKDSGLPTEPPTEEQPVPGEPDSGIPLL
jgi:rhodanese-related sulfurtransferase